jgi:hypothetical protein
LMVTPIDRFREQLRQAGIRDDKPLHGVLMTIYEAAECARETAKGARALTPEGEADLIQCVGAEAAKEAAQGAERQAHRLLLRFNTGLALKAALILFAVGLAGIWAGYEIGRSRVEVTERAIAAAFQDGTRSAETWLLLMRNNDIQAALGKCRDRAVRVMAGRKACSVPLWLDGPTAAP